MENLLSLVIALTVGSKSQFANVVGFDKIHMDLFGKGVTEQVLDGSIAPKLRRVHTNMENGKFYQLSHDANFDNVIVHCQQALRALGLSEYTGECGNPTTGRTRKQ